MKNILILIDSCLWRMYNFPFYTYLNWETMEQNWEGTNLFVREIPKSGKQNILFRKSEMEIIRIMLL